MENNTTKIKTNLNVIATENAKAIAEKDLCISDPQNQSLANLNQEGENVEVYAFGPIGSGC